MRFEPVKKLQQLDDQMYQLYGHYSIMLTEKIPFSVSKVMYKCCLQHTELGKTKIFIVCKIKALIR